MKLSITPTITIVMLIFNRVEEDILYITAVHNLFTKMKEIFEKFGIQRQYLRGECFAHSGDVMEYVGWTVSGGFKYSLTASNGVDKTIGFALADSIMINYECDAPIELSN